MAKFKVKKGKKYRGRIVLGWMESFASNGMLADKLRFIGFVDVIVRGSGSQRIAEGRWMRDDAEADLPSQVNEVIEVTEA